MVNSEMIRTGYAHTYTYPPDVKYSDLFFELEREARENEYGLWAEPETTASTEQTTTTIAATTTTTIATTTTTTVAVTTTTESMTTTTQAQPEPQGQYVGSIKSDVFHYPDCFYVDRIKPENIIWFSSREDAIAHGYRPCKKCCP
jgi:micrococcal nuclease